MSREFFDKWAEVYDEKMAHAQSFPCLGYDSVLQAVRSMATCESDMTVLDVGVGTGALSEPLYQNGCKIYGVDLSPRMIEIACTKMPRAKFEICDLAEDHLGRFRKLRFDRIVSSYCFHHFDDELKVASIRRLVDQNLVDGGRVVIGDVGFATETEFAKAQEQYRDLWDDDEFYLCGEQAVARLLEAGLTASFQQISKSGGVLTITK